MDTVCERTIPGNVDYPDATDIDSTVGQPATGRYQRDYFQVRAEADALYRSSYEPWSRFLTGVQGKAPSPVWDPLQFMIDECHKRGMELHAWINPYRAKTKGTGALSPMHPANRYPGLIVRYNGQLYFDPGYPESRQYICKIVRDIVTRYDVDAIHMDDYFIPIRIREKSFRMTSVLPHTDEDSATAMTGAGIM